MVIITEARTNAGVNLKKPNSYWDYGNYSITVGDIDRYHIYQRMGQGKYSEVFEGRFNKEKIVIKVLKPVGEAKIKREIMILRCLDHPNIIKLMDVVKDPYSNVHSLIFEHIEHSECIKLFESFTYRNIVDYSRQMLEALRYCHSRGIIHRDIKPQNMIINEAKNELKLIDLGLAEFYHPKQKYSVKVASRYYKSPELLVSYPYYDYSLDIWSFGCVLAEMVFKRRPFFYGENNTDQLTKISKVLGYPDLKKYVEKYDISAGIKQCEQSGERIPLSSFVPIGEGNKFDKAINLLEKILVYDHQERFSAEECLQHEFYK
jgi:casein kinase II subunit alpha